MKNSHDEYYNFQSECRNIKTASDVEKIATYVTPAYNRIFPRWLPSSLSAPIHEVACGPGIFLRWLDQRGFTNITACDLSFTEVELAKQASANVFHGNAIEHLREFSEYFSTIVALDFIEHISRQHMFEFLRNAYASLEPGGNLVLRMPNGDSPFVGRNLYNDVTHEWAYTTVSLRAVAKICKFEGVEFLDDTYLSIQKCRTLKLPFMWAAQFILKNIFRAATHERFDYIGPTVYACLRKPLTISEVSK